MGSIITPIQSHVAGERFILVEREAMSLVDVPPGIGRVRVMAAGIADSAPPQRSLERPGQALHPLAPAHVRVRVLANDDTEITWVRRSRNGWRWLDGADAPLVEEAERYAVTMIPDAGPTRTSEQPEPRLIYPVSARIADRASGVTRLEFSICQIGSLGLSRPTRLNISLN